MKEDKTKVLAPEEEEDFVEKVFNSNIKFDFEKQEEPVVFTSKGYYSEEIRKEFDQMSDEEKKHQMYLALQKCQKNGDILWGKITGIKPYQSRKNSFYISAKFNGVEILIDESVYFMPNYKFGLRYLSLSEEEKLNWRKFIVRQSMDAWVCFTVKAVVDRPVGDLFDDASILVCLGDRVEALKKLQDICFFHKNRKDSTPGEPITIKVGQLVEAHILNVKEDLVCVEACGVEVKLDALSISNEYIENCCDVYKAGQKINLYVKKVDTDENGDIILHLTGRNQKISEKMALVNVGDVYFGHVTKYSPASDNYSIYLSNGISAIVSQKNVEGHRKLIYGDRVTVKVTVVFADRVLGNAIKI